VPNGKRTFTVTVNRQTTNLPDLTVAFSTRNATCPGTHACTDGSTIVTINIKNQGTAPSAASVLKLYVSNNDILDASDTPLLVGKTYTQNPQCGGLPYSTNIVLPNLAAGATLDTFVYIGGSPVDAYIIGKIDANNTVAESNENNNIFIECLKPNLGNFLYSSGRGQDTIRTAVPTVNEFQIIYSIPSQYTCIPSGSSFAYNYLTSSSLTYYLSTDTVLSANDIVVPYVLTATQSFGIHLTDVTVPNTVPSGIYYLIAKANVANVCAGTPTTRSIFRRVVVVNGSVTNQSDIVLNITATPSVYTRYAPLSFTISAKNTTNQAFTNVKVQFKFPANTTTGGTATPSVGTWQEWCAGGIQCYTWTIPTLAANATQTLNVPLYVLNATAPIVATTTLLGSTPTTALYSATITVNPAAGALPLAQAQATQLIPVVIQSIAPNPSDGEVIIALESLDAREVQFDFSNSIGSTIHSEKRAVEKGQNRLLFDTSSLPQGVYLVSPTTHQGHKVPTKFVKL
jgi:hypothetical protein